MVVTCCVCGVEKGSWQDCDLTFHYFPKDEDLKLKWMENIGKKIKYNATVCSKHFKAEDYKNHEDLNLIRKLLKPSAIPNGRNMSKELKHVENSSSSSVIHTSTEKDQNERKKDDNISQKKKQRIVHPTLGVMRREDFTNENSWLRFLNFVKEIQKQQKMLSRRNMKLSLKIKSFENLWKRVPKKLLLSHDVSNKEGTRGVPRRF